MNQSPMKDFLNSFSGNDYPEEFLARYEPVECLSHNQMGETLLVRERMTAEYSIVKCYCEKSLLSSSSNESDLLKKLHHRGLPEYIDEYVNDSMLCVVREYVRGIPLDRLASAKRLTEKQAIAICLQLCDILSYLHTQKPPVIHRDIKPQNIILGDDGKIKLIDFGISRIYDEAAQEDTVAFGTKLFAAPEQYGFSQSDGRTDLFSLGVLLCWLLTGEADIRRGIPCILNKRLAAVVRKCTAFSPEDRYMSATKVRDVLSGTRRRRVAAIVCTAVLAAGAVIAVIGSLIAGGFHAVRLKEPLIEQAVRLALAKDEGIPITEDDLLSVSELYIFGDFALDGAEAYTELVQRFASGDKTIQRGPITSLKDLSKMKNLRQLTVGYQNISDLKPLSELESLELLNLNHNPVSDVSPLSDHASLKMLLMFGTLVSDFSSLSSCPNLRLIDAGDTPVQTMEAFDGIGTLRELVLRKAALGSLDGIEGLAELQKLYIPQTNVTDLTPLNGLPYLTMVEVSQDMREHAKALGETDFDVMYQ